MDWWIYLAIIGAGFLAGFINTLAGSGSLVSLPLLIFAGLPANVANGTNRIAILLQNVVGVGSFHKQKLINYKSDVFLAIPAVVGSIIGAFLAVDINEKMMNNVIAGLLVVMFFLILFKPDIWVKGQAGIANKKKSFLQIIIFFFIGLYGGFIQAGVGFFLLSGLVLGAGLDLVRANAVKLFIVLIYTPFALLVFAYNDQINWELGFILAIGNMSGAFVASKLAIIKGASFVRWILLIVILFASAKLFGLFGLIM